MDTKCLGFSHTSQPKIINKFNWTLFAKLYLIHYFSQLQCSYNKSNYFMSCHWVEIWSDPPILNWTNSRYLLCMHLAQVSNDKFRILMSENDYNDTTSQHNLFVLLDHSHFYVHWEPLPWKRSKIKGRVIFGCLCSLMSFIVLCGLLNTESNPWLV